MIIEESPVGEKYRCHPFVKRGRDWGQAYSFRTTQKGNKNEEYTFFKRG